MKKEQAVRALQEVCALLDYHSKNVYHHSTKERHVREVLSDLAEKMKEPLEVLAAKGKGRK